MFVCKIVFIFNYRYGIHLKVIHTSSEVTEKLTQLLKQCAFYLQQQQRPEHRGGHAKISILYKGTNYMFNFVWPILVDSLTYVCTSNLRSCILVFTQ